MARENLDKNVDSYDDCFDKVNDNFIELYNKIEWKPLDFKTESAKPNEYPSQQTTIFIATQSWQGVGNVIIRTEKYNDNIAIQYLQPNGSLSIPIMYRLAIPTTNTWTAWKNILTNEQPNWITATLQNGWTGNLKYRKNQIGQIEIAGYVHPGTTAWGTIIATLPAGYYDPSMVSPFLMYSDIGRVYTGIVLTGNGEIAAYSPYADSPNTAGNNFHIRLTISSNV